MLRSARNGSKCQEPTLPGALWSQTPQQTHLFPSQRGICSVQRDYPFFGAVGSILSLNSDEDTPSVEISRQDLIITIVGLVFNVVGLVGGVIYNIYLVGAATAALIASFVAGVFFSIEASRSLVAETDSVVEGSPELVYGGTALGLLISLAFTVLTVYPHVGFIMEVRSGVMKPETYEREKSSCCCV